MTEPTDPPSATLDSAQLQDRAVRGVAWTMLHTVISVPTAFAVNLLLARTLAPEGYGRLAFLTALITIVGSIIALGLSSAMIQFGARAHAAGRAAEVRQILSSAQGFRLLVVAPLLTALVLWQIDVSTGLLVLAIIFGVWVPAALDGAPIALFIENKSAAGAKIALVSNLVVQVGVVAAVLWIGTADAVWAARIVLAAVGIGLALLAIAPAYRRAVLTPRLPRHFPPGFWRFALPTGLAALVGELALSRSEVVFLTWLSTPEEVGLFALAFGVSAHIFAPAHALTGPLIPAISGLQEIGADRVAEAFSRTLRTTSVVIALLTTAALPALTALVPLLYGEEYRRSAPALLVLGLVGGALVAAGPVTAFVLARLSARRLLAANLWALAADIALAVLLIPSMGLWGAVIANGCAVLVQVSILLEGERRALGLGVVAVIRMLAPVLIAAAACVLAWLVTLLTSWPALPAAVASALIALALLSIGMRVTGAGIDDGDRDAILRNLPARLAAPARRGLGLVTRR